MTDLEPEELVNYQAILRFDSSDGQYYVEAAYYVNDLDNMIIRKDGFRRNAGKFYSHEIELEGRFLGDKFDFRTYYTLVRPKESEAAPITSVQKISNGKFKNLAEHTIAADLTYSISDSFDLSFNAKWESGFLDKNDTRLSSKVICNMTLIAKRVAESMDVSLSIYNLFDEQYKPGDDALSPLPQQGRWFLLGISTDF